MGLGTRPTLGENLSITRLFSVQHLGGGDVPDGYEEMVCDSCMASHDFLKPYKLRPPVKVGGGGEGQEVDVTTEESKLEKHRPLQPEKTEIETSSGGSREQQSAGPTDSTGVSTSTSATADQPSGSGGACELDRRRRLPLGVSGNSEEGAGYLSATWRSELCRCQQCMVS